MTKWFEDSEMNWDSRFELPIQIRTSYLLIMNREPNGFLMRNSLILSSMLILFVPWYIFGTNPASLAPLPTSNYAKFGTPYPTYQFASWAGGGTAITNDSFIQEAYMPTASM